MELQQALQAYFPCMEVTMNECRRVKNNLLHKRLLGSEEDLSSLFAGLPKVLATPQDDQLPG